MARLTRSGAGAAPLPPLPHVPRDGRDFVQWYRAYLDAAHATGDAPRRDPRRAALLSPGAVLAAWQDAG